MSYFLSRILVLFIVASDDDSIFAITTSDFILTSERAKQRVLLLYWQLARVIF